MKLCCYCSHPGFTLLAYEYLGGSLDKVQNNERQAVAFDWSRTVNAIKGLTIALSYMHHDCRPAIIHRDISSKNILFDPEYEVHVSGFGTSKLPNLDSSNWTTFGGTI